MPRLLFSTTGYTVGTKEATELEGIATTPADATALASGPCTGISVTGAGNVAGTLASGGTFCTNRFISRSDCKNKCFNYCSNEYNCNRRICLISCG